jgi:dihydropteroate synthase
VLLDPGIGFGTTLDHNLQLLARLQEIVALGRPVLVGTSRKAFLGRIGGDADGSRRLGGTIASNVLALERGARVFRVHEVAPVREALAVAAATLGGRWTTSLTPTTPTT